MKITIESTPIITTYHGARVRLWKGVTESGISCGLFIAGLAVAKEADGDQFSVELTSIAVPSELTPLAQVFDPRMF